MLVGVVSPEPGVTLVDKAGWMCDGIWAAGHYVYRVHSLEQLAVADRDCDLVLLDQKGAGLNHNSIADMAASKKTVWACAWRDLIMWDKVPLVEQDDSKLFSRMLRGMNVVFVKERNLTPQFAKLGINAVYLDTQGCPADMPPCAHKERPEFDVLVLGRTDYRQRRRDVQALVSAGYQVVWAGLPDSCGVPEGVTVHPWVHPTKELPALASRCACALGCDLRCDSGYTSDRTYLLAGTGIPLIARVPDIGTDWGVAALSEVAPQADVASWCYSDEAGLLACVKGALETGLRRECGERARRRVMERHTYRQRAEKIVGYVGTLTA